MKNSIDWLRRIHFLAVFFAGGLTAIGVGPAVLYGVPPYVLVPAAIGGGLFCWAMLELGLFFHARRKLIQTRVPEQEARRRQLITDARSLIVDIRSGKIAFAVNKPMETLVRQPGYLTIKPYLREGWRNSKYPGIVTIQGSHTESGLLLDFEREVYRLEREWGLLDI